MRALREVYTALAEDAAAGADVASGRMAARQLPHRLGRRARHPPRSAAVVLQAASAIAADEFAGLPAIYALALELIGSSAGRLDAQRLQRFISAFQSVTPLTIGELWAWPSALKLALLDHLRARATCSPATRVHRLAADRLAAAIDRPTLRRLAGAGPSRVRDPAAAALARARRDRVGAAPPARRGAAARADRRSRTRSERKDSTRRPSRPAWPT